MKFHTTFIDKEPNTLNVFLLLDIATTNTIFRDKKYFLYLGLVMTKHIITITGSYLISYQLGKVCLVMPGGTRIHVSRVIYSPISKKKLLNF